jgi:glycosyltransferase involved in cell wall biosynthesis
MSNIIFPEDLDLYPLSVGDTLEQRRIFISKFLADNDIHRALKVLIVTNSLASGGEEHQVMRLIPEMIKLGIQAEHLYYSAPHTLAEKYNACCIKSTWIDKNGQSKFLYFKKLTNHIKLNKYDIVHAFGGTATIYARIAAVFAGTRLILAGSRNRTGPQGRLSIVINSLLNLFTSAWVINSSTNAEGVGKLKFMKNKPLYILPNALSMDGDFMQPGQIDQNLLNWIGDRKIVAAIGRLCSVKNYDMFIDLAKKVHGHMQNSCFLIIGGPDCTTEGEIYEKRLSLRIVNEKLDSFVKITGRIDALDGVYPHIDLLVSTSRSEGCPNVVLEAMRAAKPIVMTRSCDTNRIILEGQNGYVLGPDDLEGMVQRVLQILCSESKRKQFGYKSRELVETYFSSPNAAWILAKIYLAEIKKQRAKFRLLQKPLCVTGLFR